MVKTRSKVSKEEKWQLEYLYARPSDEEVKELKKNFEPTKSVPRK